MTYGYRPNAILVGDFKGSLLQNMHTILNIWKTHFSQLSEIREVNEVRQGEIHAAEPSIT
jgi:hypothetical protein